jgi:hypothetical protein
LVEVAAAAVSESGGGKERELMWGEVRNVGPKRTKLDR